MDTEMTEAPVDAFLPWARRLINEDQPSEALQAMATAMRNKGDNRIRELQRNKVENSAAEPLQFQSDPIEAERAAAAANELATLLDECAIAKVTPSNSTEWSECHKDCYVELGVRGASIRAAETGGRKQIVLDAFGDGSRFICLRCGGLISNPPKEEHASHNNKKMRQSTFKIIRL